MPLQDYANQPGTLFSGYQPNPEPMFGFGGGNPLLSAASMLAQPAIAQQMLSRGMMPVGFHPSANLIDIQRNRDFIFKQQIQSMTIAAPLDSNLSSAIGRFSGAMGNMAGNRDFGNTAALIAPGMWDALQGSRGSARTMASGFLMGGQSLIDPFTGRMGYSAESAGTLARESFQRMYSQGDRSMVGMHGISGGQAGSMFDEMSRRGMMGGISDIAQVSGLDGSRSSALLRGANVAQITTKLKDMSGAVAAMKEIFGEAGDTNAPMWKIFNTLNAITQGQMHTMGGQKVEGIVRHMQSLVRTAGVPMEAQMGVMAQGGAMAQQLGLDRSFGVSSGLSALNFGRGFGAMAGNQGFGGVSKDEATALDQQLRLGAAASPMANQMAAAVSMQEKKMLTPGSVGEAMASAVKAHQQYFQHNGQTYNLATMQPTQVREMLVASGGGANQVNQFMTNRGALQETIQRHGIQDFTRSMQGEGSIKQIRLLSIANGMASAMADAGIGGRERQQMMPGLANAIDRALAEMDPAVRAGNDPENTEKRNAILKNAMRQVPGADRLPDNVLERMANGATNMLQHNVTNQPGLQKFGNMSGLYSMNRKDILKFGESSREENEKWARLRSGAAGVFQKDPTRRLIDSLAKGDSMADVVKNFLGGRQTREMAPYMEKMLNDLKDNGGMNSTQIDEFRKEFQKTMAAGTAAEIESGLSSGKDIDQIIKGVRRGRDPKETNDLIRAAVEKLKTGGTLTPEQSAAMITEADRRMEVEKAAGGKAKGDQSGDGDLHITGTLTIKDESGELEADANKAGGVPS